MKRKFALALTLAVVVSGMVFSTVLAGGWGGSFGMHSLFFDGYFAGLGNHDARVTLTATGTVKAFCQNNGGNIAPGRNPITFTSTETGTWLTDENGRADGLVEAPDPTLATSPVGPKGAGCPSNTWTVVGYDTRTTNWTSAHLHVAAQDDPNNVFFDLNFSCVTSFDANGFHTGVTCTFQP